MHHRWHFLSVGLTLPGVAQADILKQAAANPNIKPISGSWFEFQHPGGKEGVYWDKDLRQFTAAQWREKIREISETGMEYLVMMNVAAHGKAFFDTKLAPKFEMGCEDPIETVLSAADEFGVKFFVSNDYWGPDLDAHRMMTDRELGKKRNQSMEEIYKFGFAGLRLTPEGPALDPSLPRSWKSLRFRFLCRGQLWQAEIAQNSPPTLREL